MFQFYHDSAAEAACHEGDSIRQEGIEDTPDTFRSKHDLQGAAALPRVFTKSALKAQARVERDHQRFLEGVNREGRS